MKRHFNPASWAGFIPNGLGEVKPNHYLEMMKAIWENRDELPFAWRILNNGVCDGCALGTTGLRDFTMSSVHLCTVRLSLLRLNTMPALELSVMGDAERLGKMSARTLRNLGRLPYPMIRKKGEAGFTRISWDDALDRIAVQIRKTNPKEMAFFLTSRGITNETYYVAQKVARFLGTNNIDNSARVCHSPSTIAMKQTIGYGASTCSYKDWIGSDLLVFIGSNVPNNQPVTTKYLYLAKQQGTKVAVINPYREPGLERYWVPSVLESALFGTKLADEFFHVHIGGDIAFLNGVLRILIQKGWVDDPFIRARCSNFDEMRNLLNRQSFESLERGAGASRAEMERFADLYGRAKSCIFVWSMGITQHSFGVDMVKSIVNLALSRGMIGRKHCGLMPIRGHSGVQGGNEMGCAPLNFPGGEPIHPETAKRFSELWGFEVPFEPGTTAVEMIDAAHEGKINFMHIAGGNFLETLPEPDWVKEALTRIPFRIHQDIVLSPQMFVDPMDTAILLPAATRYEQPGGGTETTTERYVIYSPEIPGRRIGEARSEWEIFMQIGERVCPERNLEIHFEGAGQIREEIAKVIPLYDGIQRLKKKGDAFQWGGPLLCVDGNFKTPDGKARFFAISPPDFQIPEGMFFVSTRRGKQFNSMVHADRDPLTGALRSHVLMNREDAESFGLQEGDSILLRSEAGEMHATVKIAMIRLRNLQVHWPEGNVLLKHGVRDKGCGIPDYNAIVKIIPLPRTPSGASS